MKFVLFFTALFFNTNTTFGNDTNNPYSFTEEETEIENVFFIDEENQFIFIDFESITTTVFEVRILQGENEILIEDVKDLDQNMIYELDLSILGKGDYTIECETKDQRKFTQKIVLQ